MILGLMSDIHGNSTALGVVMADSADVEVDAWWVLGDLVAFGPEPVKVIEMIQSLPNVTVIAGNTDRYVTNGDRPYPLFEDARADPALLERLVEVAESIVWTRGMVTSAGHYDWLATLGGSIQMTFPDGTRLLGVHASPKSDDGVGIDTRIPDSDLAALLDGCDAELVVGGHTHDVTDRLIGGVRAVNLGSVSNSHRADRCATYALLHVDNSDHRLERRTVDYDHHLEVRALERVHHPAADYIRNFHS